MPVDTHPAEGWGIRYGEREDALTAGKYWRYTAWAVSGLATILAVACWHLGTLPKDKPFPVHIDNCGGTVRVLPPSPETYTLLELAIQDKVAAFVKGLRGISADQEVTKQNWRALERQVTPKGAYKVVEESERSAPLKKQVVVAVDQVRVFKRTQHTFDVRWQETTFSNTGPRRELLGTATWSGLFTTIRRAPVGPEEREYAPTGTFFDDWQFEKDH